MWAIIHTDRPRFLYLLIFWMMAFYIWTPHGFAQKEDNYRIFYDQGDLLIIVLNSSEKSMPFFDSLHMGQPDRPPNVMYKVARSADDIGTAVSEEWIFPKRYRSYLFKYPHVPIQVESRSFFIKRWPVRELIWPECSKGCRIFLKFKMKVFTDANFKVFVEKETPWILHNTE